jgi:hypothetical protein
MTLAAYLINCSQKLRDNPSIALDLFLDLRYRELRALFPHDTFSVGQASLDFFDTALAHLNGVPFAKTEGEPSVYEANYRRWIVKHRA